MIAKTRSGAVLFRIASGAVPLIALATGANAASLVIDVDSGKVLHAEQATAPWYPASVTKLMTAYVALKEVREGRITMDTPLIVSVKAAAATPSKVGFKPGMEVTLENALRIIMVKSANDVSITIAEGIGGSVETFSAMMNREAARLGMVDSNFTNPNGLPDDDNRSSARDMALLGRALLREFPDRDDLWGIGAIKLGKRVMQNTNGLVGRYPGALGMKTGFICASGFNVVAAAERNGRRLIAVVMGSGSAAERTIKTAELLDKGFAAGDWGAPSIESLPPGVGLPPNLRADVCGKRRGIQQEDEGEAPVAASITGESVHDNPLKNLFQPQTTPGVASVRGEGGRYALAPRARFEPIVVYAGRKPGSVALARGPVNTNVASDVPLDAQAFAPAGAAAAKPVALKEGPLMLQGNGTGRPSAGPGIGFGATSTSGARLGAIQPAAKPLPKPDAKPLTASAKPLATPAAKPLAATAAKPLAAPKPAVVPAAAAKPVASSKPLVKPASVPAGKPPAVNPKPTPKPAAQPAAKPQAAGPLKILPTQLKPAR